MKPKETTNKVILRLGVCLYNVVVSLFFHMSFGCWGGCVNICTLCRCVVVSFHMSLFSCTCRCLCRLFLYVVCVMCRLMCRRLCLLLCVWNPTPPNNPPNNPFKRNSLRVFKGGGVVSFVGGCVIMACVVVYFVDCTLVFRLLGNLLRFVLLHVFKRHMP